MIAIAVAAGPVRLVEAPVRVPLSPPAGGAGIASAIESMEPGERLFLVLRDLSAAEPPGVLYHLYLSLPPGAVPAEDDPRHAGSINFYAAVRPEPAEPGSAFHSFDVTEAIRALGERGELDEPLMLTILPAGEPAGGSGATVGRIELVVQRP
jgi:hypothetical protein